MQDYLLRLEQIWGKNVLDSSSALNWIQDAVTRKAEEGLHLDFKQKSDPSDPSLADDDKANLAKAISGFANTDGGLIIWGVKAKTESKLEPDVAISIHPISNLKMFLTRLNSLSGEVVTPPVASVENRAVPDSSKLDTGYVITIVPKRRDVLVQANAKTCKGIFIRTGSGFHQLPPSLIAEFYSRKPLPILRLYLSLPQPVQLTIDNQYLDPDQQHLIGQNVVIPWSASLKNEGLGSALQVIVDLKTAGNISATINDRNSELEKPLHPGQEIPVLSGKMVVPLKTFNDSTAKLNIQGFAYALDSPLTAFDESIDASELKERFQAEVREKSEQAKRGRH